jgi:hypothetical protein
VTDDVCTRNPETLQQEPAMRRMLRNADRPSHSATAAAADSVIVNETVTARQGRLVQQRSEPVGENPGMNEQYRLTTPMNLVLKFDVFEYRPIHSLLHPPGT